MKWAEKLRPVIGDTSLQMLGFTAKRCSNQEARETFFVNRVTGFAEIAKKESNGMFV